MYVQSMKREHAFFYYTRKIDRSIKKCLINGFV